MSGEPVKSLDPNLLLEASRVMNAAGREYAKATRLVSDWAVQNLAKADPPTRAAILGDAAALRLRTPGHYDDALEKLQEIDSPNCPDLDGRLHMLRALANGQKYTALKRKNETAQKPEDKTPETALIQLRQKIREDLAVAFQRDKTAKRDNEGYWKPRTTEKGDVAEDDLRQVYDDDPEFKKLVDSDPLAAAVDAYIFGYPLVTMEMTRRVMTNTEKSEDLRAPMGQFASARDYRTAAFKDFTAPNADTLYSSAWLDLSQGPWVLQLPDEHGRYYLMPMLDGWTDVFADPGTRTTGTSAGEFAIVGPGWHGELPPGVEELRSPTNLVWVLGRTYCTGTPEDYTAVRVIQDQYKLKPLSAYYHKPYTPPPAKVDPSIDMKAPPRDQVERMDTMSYFKLLAELIKQNLPNAADAPMLPLLARIGLVPGQDFEGSKLAAVPNIQDVPKRGVERITAHFPLAGADLNGWVFFKPCGIYSTNYIQRALVTRLGLGCNLTEDAVYLTASTDSAGRKLDGANEYVIRFPKGQMPPVRGFWSLTMYDAQYFFVANPLNRYTLSPPRNALKTNPDGLVELYIQAADPGGDHQANWLPAPSGPFVLMLRLYWPKEHPPSLLDGTWQPPAIERIT